jgi:2-polyprenyl-6-hydroxyphenyl methylase/3-demethylubiquinone-9 3-methyltransferase
VRPKGLFAFALYRKTPWCRFWKLEKRLYSRAPRVVQNVWLALYVAAFAFRQWTLSRSFRAFLRQYKQDRGMDFYHDVHDWLGGYPYESTCPQQVAALMAALGFDRVRDFLLTPSSGAFGTGCDEYVYRRRGPAVGSSVPAASATQAR